jgi:hypothetical protein
MRSAIAEWAVPDFDGLVARRRNKMRRRLAAGSAVVAAAGIAGAGAYASSAGPAKQQTVLQSPVGSTTTMTRAGAVPERADGPCSTVALDLSVDPAGQASPIAAAQWFAQHGGVGGYPSEGWRVIYKSADHAQVQAANADADVVRGADGTWRVDSAQRCS